MTSMESTHSAHDRDALNSDAPRAASTTGDQYVVPPLQPDAGPASPTSVCVWGPTGHGKTQFAATLTTDPGYAPALYIDVDGGRPALAGYEAADLIVWRGAKTIADVTALVRDVTSGRIRNRAGQKPRSVIVDALSSMQAEEIAARNIGGQRPQDQCLALIQPFNVLFAHLRSLWRDHGLTTVALCHSKDKPVKVGDVVHDLIVPGMFPAIATAVKQFVRHCWRITKTRGSQGPAYPTMMLRTEEEGVLGTPLYNKYYKTSNQVFSQWLAGRGGKREQLQWDTGTMPLEEQPTLASLLRVCESLVYEQGHTAVTDPAALRSYNSLMAAIEAADAANAVAT